MLTVTIIKGLPASGKSTWAKQMVSDYPNQYKRISKDDLRDMIDNGIHTRGNEGFILTARDSLIIAAIKSGFHVIVDDTNLNPIHEKRIGNIISEFNKQNNKEVRVIIKEFNQPLNTCLKWDSLRTKSVGEEVIKSMYGEYIYAKDWVTKTMNETIPFSQYMVVDMDGTLSNTQERIKFVKGENKKNWKLFFNFCVFDQPRQEVLQQVMIHHFSNNHMPIVIVSARPDTYRNQTEKWLHEHGIRYEKLLMRNANDKRTDDIVKQEMLDQYMNKDHISVAFDDRKRILDMWEKNGIKTINVGGDDNDF